MFAFNASSRLVRLIAVLLLSIPFASLQANENSGGKPTIVLVHGAFADSSSWNPVISELLAKGYQTFAAANPLRGVKSDASYVASILRAIKGPVVLVGHSYGGLVISNAADENSSVKALVYVAAFAPDVGETAFQLSTKFPGSTLGAALALPISLPDGNKDLYIAHDEMPTQFAADVPLALARQMAVAQRPVTEAALNEGSAAAAWKSIPSWFIYGGADQNIPAAVEDFMAKRAGAKKAIAVPGASHAVMLSHAKEVAGLIEEAAVATATTR